MTIPNDKDEKYDYFVLLSQHESSREALSGGEEKSPLGDRWEK